MTYRLNDASGDGAIFPDCLGGSAVPPERAIDRSWFFDAPGEGAPQPSRRLVVGLTHALINCPSR